MRVEYSITEGLLPITVDLVGSGLQNVHVAYGTYSFEDVPDGDYTLLITGADGCYASEYIGLCQTCLPGYVATVDSCILYDEQSPTYSGTTYIVLKKQADDAYSVYGGLMFDTWNYDGTGTFQRFGISPVNTYWANQPWPSLTGVLNRNGVWASTTKNLQDIGFSFCINIVVPKVYYVGFACDNWGKIKLNGEFIIEQDREALKSMVGAAGLPGQYDDGTTFKYWYVYPIYLPSGDNVIEVFGHNEYIVAVVGVEIYDATPETIMNATSDADLGDGLLFRSSDLVGQDLYYEYSVADGYNGYYCDSGYALDVCTGTAKCVRRTEIPCYTTTTTSSSTTYTSTTSTSTTSTTSTSTTSTSTTSTSTTSTSTTSTSTTSTTSTSSTTTSTTSTLPPPTTSTTTTYYFLANEGFEAWTGGNPDSWDDFNPVIGNKSANVTVTEEVAIVKTGTSSARVVTESPSAGLIQRIGHYEDVNWSIYNVSGQSAIHYAKADGSSAYFSSPELVQAHFNLPGPVLSTSIRNVIRVRLDNNDYIELFNASTTAETSNEGDVYMKRNGGAPSLFMTNAGERTWVWAGFVDLTTKYTWVSMRLDGSSIMRIYGTDVDRTATTLSNNRVLFEIAATNVQVYNTLVLPGGDVIIPIAYAATADVVSGPWYLDILYSDDDLATVTRLNQPKTLSTRGLMEPHPVLLSNGTIAILCRTDRGYLAKAIYNHATKTLGAAALTNIAQPQSGSYAMNLADGSIILAWVSAEENSLTSSFPRKVIATAISDDDMATWKTFHIVSRSATFGDSMSSDFPYIHQPIIYEDGADLYYYFERVESFSAIQSYRTVATNYKINNVSTIPSTWVDINVTKPLSAITVQMLNIVKKDGIGIFDYSGPTTTSTTTLFPPSTTTTTSTTLAPTTTTTTTSAPSPLLTSLSSVWEMNESSGALADSHGSNDTDLETALSYSQTSVANLSTSIGFNGTSSIARVPHNNNIMGFGDFSVSAWYKTSTVGIQLIMEKIDFTNGYGWQFIDINGYIRMNIGDTNNSGSRTLKTATAGYLADGGWHHVAATWDWSTPGDLKLYVDGSEVAGTLLNTGGDNFDNSNTAVAYIGIDQNDGSPRYELNGNLDQIAIWTRILTPTEVSDIWNSGNGLAYVNW